MKRRGMTTILLILILCWSYNVIYAEKIELTYDGSTHMYDYFPILIEIDGQVVATQAMPPVQIDGYVLIPAREVFTEIGADVQWKAQEKKVYITRGEDLIVLEVNHNEAWVNGEMKQLDLPAKLINDKVMIPIRFIGESLGFQVSWDNIAKTVIIKTNQVVIPEEPIIPEVPAIPNEPEKEEGDGEVLPEDPESNTYNIKHIAYDALLETLILDKPEGLNSLDIEIEEDFVNRKIYINLPGNYSDFFVAGTWRDETKMIKEIAINHATITRIAITTEVIKAINIYEEGDKIYLQCMRPKDKYSKIVVLDPGHGDQDPGTTYQSLKEKDIVLQLGLALNKLLEQDSSIKVYMTRKDDSFLKLMERVEFSNELEPDLFISLHVNSVDNNPNASGTETYYTSKADTRNIIFANMVQEALVETFGTRDRGVKENQFVVTRYTNNPAILIEIGFLTNESDRVMMLREDFTQQYAQAVYSCILSYYNQGLNISAK